MRLLAGEPFLATLLSLQADFRPAVVKTWLVGGRWAKVPLGQGARDFTELGLNDHL